MTEGTGNDEGTNAIETLFASLLATPRQSDAARLIEMRGTSFRDVARGLGHYVSKGAVWDDATKRQVLAQPRILNAAARKLGVDVDAVRAVFAPVAAE